MGINKVIYNNNTLLDLSQDTVSDPSHIMQGYVGHLRDGSQVTGTGQGGGGSSNFVLLGTLSLGTMSVTSSTASDTGKKITVKGVYEYDLLVCVCSVDTKVNNRHAETTRLCWLTASSNVNTKDGALIATATHNTRISSSGVASTRGGTTAYGIYAYSCTVSAGNTGDNGQAEIVIYQRYASSITGTINGQYTMRVYGCKIYDLIGG